MEKITKENCNQIADLNQLNASSTGRAWELVWDFCRQNGMRMSDGNSGLQDVIGFIESLLKKEELKAERDLSKVTIDEKIPCETNETEEFFFCVNCLVDSLNFLLHKQYRKIKKLKKKNKKLQKDIVILQITNPHQA